MPIYCSQEDDEEDFEEEEHILGLDDLKKRSTNQVSDFSKCKTNLKHSREITKMPIVLKCMFL